jgi:DNA-binding Xre family transcriptional regulator
MTSFHASDRDLHTREGGHKSRPPAGLDDPQRAAWRERMRRHELRHEMAERPIGRAIRTDVAPEFDAIRGLCGRPLGRHIAALLTSREVTQVEAAAELGVTHNALKQKLAGKIAWQLPEVLYLCRRLNADIQDILASLHADS